MSGGLLSGARGSGDTAAAAAAVALAAFPTSSEGVVVEKLCVHLALANPSQRVGSHNVGETASQRVLLFVVDGEEVVQNAKG